MALKFETRMVGRVAVVSCSGPIAFGEQATELHIHTKGLLTDGRLVLLDLRDVPYVDSAGVGTLFAIYASTLTSHAKLALAGLSPRVHEILETSRLLSLVQSYAEAEQALQALTGS
ncbi:MAG: STAS domain-containing protein [Acidobacteriia bacterium]|nr:STAS domain-containing protein [Terriglobia bacterium]